MHLSLTSSLLCFSFLASLSRADVVHFRDGGTVEGIVVKDDPQTVVVKVSSAELDFGKAEVVKIDYATPQERKSLEQEWASDAKKTEQRRASAAESGERWGQRSGLMAILDAELDDTLLEKSNIPEDKLYSIAQRAKIGIYYPKRFSPKLRWPLFIAMHPGRGGGISAIRSYTAFADSVGFIVAAPEIAGSDDSEYSRYYYVLHAIHYLQSQKVVGAQPVWIGGFSGGAKWAMRLAAWGGALFTGMVAIACNEDLASEGYRELRNTSALLVPYFIINGTDDRLAGTLGKDYADMMASLKQTGFRNITAVAFEGGHQIPVRETMRVFLDLKQRQ